MNFMKSMVLFEKKWLFLTLLLVLTVACFAGCQKDDVAPETTDSQTEEQSEAKPVYTADTETFQTFDDLKENLDLFRDQLPCYRSTEGYHSVGDGGAGRYRLTKQKPNGAFIRVTEGVYAKLELVEGMQVTPQHFGAYGDGKQNDTVAVQRAIQFANDNKLELRLPEAEYRTMTTMSLQGLTVRSENAKISYYGKEFNRPAIDILGDVNVYGTFHVNAAEMYSPRSDKAPYHTHGNRCAVAFGSYDTGVGAHNCYIQDLVIWGGGMMGANGILVTGDSSNLTFDKVTVPKDHNNVNTVFMIHWGNYLEHHPVDFDPSIQDVYAHEEGAGTTKHPHDIKIGVIESYAMNAAIYISASYNITVDEVYSYNSEHAIAVIHGDLGMLYADEDVKALGMQNIHFKKVVGTGLTDYGAYINTAMGYENDPNLNAVVKIDSMELTGANNNDGNGLAIYGVKDLEIGTLTLKRFKKSALQLGHTNKNVLLDNVTLERCTGTVVTTVMHDKFGPNEKVVINTLNVTEGGHSGATFAYLPKTNGLHIKTLNLNKVYMTSLLQVYSHTKNIRIDSLNFTQILIAPEALINAMEQITASNNISIGTVTGGEGIPVSTGKPCDVQVGNG